MGRVPPPKQVELQLGHLCNNRCVFCVSGQETALGRAAALDAAPLVAEVRRARAEGHDRITLLGGEPTLQPAFLEVVREAVASGFGEIVIFTNGVKTARDAFVDEILATGGRFTFRVSVQGATREAHERTTRKPGSWARILRSMEHLRARGQRIEVNLCVVRSNVASLPAFPELCARFGVSQLHLDLVRPRDAGHRTEDELRAMTPRLAELAPPMRAMIAGFPTGFDVNLGNVPYCAMPDLAPFIHHDGEPTRTIAVDGARELSAPWDKYAVKRQGKVKPDACRACAFDDRCSGVFDEYRAFFGTDELVPVDDARLAAIDPDGRLAPRAVAPPMPPAPLARSVAVRLARLRSAAPFGALRFARIAVVSAARAEATFVGPEGERAVVWLVDEAGRASGGYRVEGDATAALVEGLGAVMAALAARTEGRARLPIVT
jgi:MoaA/NifB/PqqE/SkfB family radical SAM enzyme